MLVSTIDFFYPLVLDPYLQGKIGCANVLSDLYAMGIHNCDNMLMVLAASLEMDPKHRHIVTQEMLRGFADLAKEAETVITGGQTVLNPWPIIGPPAVPPASCRARDAFLTRGVAWGQAAWRSPWSRRPRFSCRRTRWPATCSS